MLFHLGYQYDVNRQTKVVLSSKAHPWVKALFAQCDGIVLPPLNDMELPAHIPNGWIEHVAIKTINPLVEGEFISMFQVEGVWNFTPPYK